MVCKEIILETNRTFSIKFEEFHAIAYGLDRAIMLLEDIEKDECKVCIFDLEEQLGYLRRAKDALAGRL